MGLGKVSFLTTFFQHATFITSGNDPSGSMGELHVHVSGNAEATNSGYSFLRLIGCAYYKQHISAFRSQTPEALFHSVNSGTSTYDHHNRCLSEIRSTVRQRIIVNRGTLTPLEKMYLGTIHVEMCNTQHG